MKQAQYNCQKISGILKSAIQVVDDKVFLTKDLKGFTYAECKPFSEACLVNIIALKGSEVRLSKYFSDYKNQNKASPKLIKYEHSIENYTTTSSLRMLKVSLIKVHSVVLLPNVAVIPRNFITFKNDEIIADFKLFSTGKKIDYAHSSKGDLYIKNSIKTCQISQGFQFYFNASDVILTALQRA